MAEAPVYTFRDTVEHLLDSLDLDLTARNRRLAKQAILTAYRDIPNAYRWKAFERRHVMKTTADYSTGTVEFDLEGGAYDRMLTLTDGTWPTDAAEGRVIIDNCHYDVATRESSTIVTLAVNSCPSADVTAGETYTWYRSTYALPVDFRKICHIFDIDNEIEIRIVGSDAIQNSTVAYYDSPDTPTHAAIRVPNDYYNSTSIEFSPPPAAAVSYDILYEASPRRLLVEKYATGTVTITAGETTVAGTTTVFPADCVGSIIRFGTTTVEPTSEIGGLDESSVWQNNLYVAQRTIMTRDGDTTITVDSTVSSTLTTVKYTISDPIDIQVAPMYTAFLRAAEAEFARMTSHKLYQDRRVDARQALILAMEADQRATYSFGPVLYTPFSRVTITDST